MTEPDEQKGHDRQQEDQPGAGYAGRHALPRSGVRTRHGPPLLSRPLGARVHERLEGTPALFERAELVEGGAGRRKQHDVARRGHGKRRVQSVLQMLRPQDGKARFSAGRRSTSVSEAVCGAPDSPESPRTRASARDEGLEGEDGVPQTAAASAGPPAGRTAEPKAAAASARFASGRKADAKRQAASPKHTTALAWQRAACTSGARSVPSSRPPRSTTGRTSSKAARALSVASTLVAFESFTHRTPATHPQGSRRCSSGAKPASAWETVRASTCPGQGRRSRRRARSPRCALP